MQRIQRTLWGIILDNLWLGTFVCLLTLFAYLIWAIIEIQNHYYGLGVLQQITYPFAPTSPVKIP